MTTYIVLIPGDEDAWEAGSDAQHQQVFDRHEQFQKLLAERGDRVVATGGLEHSRHARLIRRDGSGAVRMTEGPFAESVEQVSGFYLVETNDADGLFEACEILAEIETAVEVRRTGSSS
jgi:hypothetical protein